MQWIFFVLLVLTSFWLANHMLPQDPKFSFYMLPARAGELALGACLALSEKNNLPSILKSGLSLIGYALLATGFVVLSKDVPFPGWNALIPCMGAVCLILSSEGERENRLNLPLRLKPMVWVGILSYSIYLWHWPILAFFRYLHGEPDYPQTISLISLILAVSAASYFLVEKPFRAKNWSVKWIIGMLFLLPSVLVGTASLYLIGTNNRLSSTTEKVYAERIQRYTAPAIEFSYNCQLSVFDAGDAGVLDRPTCVHGKAGHDKVDALLWGDSHAAHYIGVVGTLAEQAGMRVRNVSLSTCPPLIQPEGDYGYEKFKPECRKFLDYMSAKVRNYPLVILGAMWSVYMRNPAFSADFKRTLETLTRNGQHVILLGQVPEFPNYDRNCELNALKTGTQSSCASRAIATQSSPPSHNRALMAIAQSMPGVEYVDIDQIVCPASQCSVYLDGRPIYFDSSHLSMDGSWVVGRYAVATPAWKQLFKVTCQTPGDC